MTQVPPSGSGPAGAGRAGETAPRESDAPAKKGEAREPAFAHVLEQEAAKQKVGAEGARSLRSFGDALAAERKKGREAEAGSVAQGEVPTGEHAPVGGGLESRVERRGEREPGSGGEGGEAGCGEEEARSLRHFAGDVVIGDGSFRFHAVAEAAAAAPTTAPSEAIARIEEIAGRIVDAVQVEMKPGGATDVRLELDLGKLGRLDVEVARGSDGNLRIDLHTASAVTRELIGDHVSELAQRLESRGLELAEIAVRAPDQPDLSWQGSGSQRDPHHPPESDSESEDADDE